MFYPHREGMRQGLLGCGAEVWLCENTDTEANTATGRRLDVTTDPKKITCKNCDRNYHSR